MTSLSILIPSRSEQYLQRTVEDIFEHSEADTEVLVFLDEIDSSLEEIYESLHSKYHERIGIFYSHESVGQRAATNELAKQSKAKYVMKLDAHCSFAQGFDRVLLSAMDDNTVMTPMLCRLDAKEWNIIATPFTKKYYFNTNLVFQYGKAEDEKDSWGLVSTMALQGSCFVVSREKYWEWDIVSEKFGSWGCSGGEIAIKTWLNGGRVVTNTDTFYGHLFRGEGQNVVEIPYVRPKHEIDHAYNSFRKFLQENKDGFRKILEKFNWPCGWSKELLEKL